MISTALFLFAATKSTIGGEVTDNLAKSCLIAYDLKHKRASHYSFDLNTISEVRELSFKTIFSGNITRDRLL